MDPAQLTTEAPAPERQTEALRSLAMRKFLGAKQSDDLRRDIASKLVMDHSFLVIKFTSGQKDKSKIKSDGSHGGKCIRGKLVSVDGSMVGVDLGTRIVGVPLDPAARASAANAAKDACTATWKSTCRTDDFGQCNHSA